MGKRIAGNPTNEPKQQKVENNPNEMDKFKEKVEEMQKRWAFNKIDEIVTELEKTVNDSHPKPFELVANSYSERQQTVLKQCIDDLGLGLKIEWKDSFYHGADPIIWIISLF